MRATYTLIGFLLSAVFLWLAFKDVEIENLGSALSNAIVWPVIPYLISFSLFYWLKAVRWRILIQSSRTVSTRQLIIPMMIGFAANNIFPFRIGEIVRVYVAGESLGISKARILATVIIERFFDLLSVAIIVIGGLVYQLTLNNSNQNANTVFLAALSAGFVSIGILLVVPRLVERYIPKIIPFLPSKFRKKADEQVVKFTAGLTVLSDSRSVLTIAANSLVQWLIISFCIYLSFIALRFELPSFAIATTIMGITVFGISMPSTAAFIGTIEYAFVFGLGIFDISPDSALAASIYYHALSFSFTTLVGAICYVCYKLTSNRSYNRQ